MAARNHTVNRVHISVKDAALAMPARRSDSRVEEVVSSAMAARF